MNDRDRTRSVPLLLLAAAVVVGVVVAVLVFGVQRPPALEELADDPAPPPSGRIAWAGYDAGETCIHLATPDGEVDRPWCGSSGGEIVAFADGRIVLQTWDIEPALLLIDAETGEATTRRLEDPDEVPLPHGEEPARPLREDGQELVVHHRGVELWRTEAPPSYEVVTVSISADGEWVALVDTAERLLVVPADGAHPPRIWARDVRGRPLVWEETGTERVGGPASD